eukprot:NODE_13341_length_1171_cov_5.232759.p1 GENE.NODE_13341_length_1171_cov_5.232759~~NODE_13341_length_1171_cov_5.232759.p1  ORF type:complete len:302 (+),score=78.80 NODE_13341_length_1171_cov_5.232759:82-987(+)
MRSRAAGFSQLWHPSAGRLRACTAGALQPRLHFLGLDGSVAALDRCVARIHELQPAQVMLETCQQRHMLAERRKTVAAVASDTGVAVAAEGGAAPMSHTDAVDVVFGGIRGADVVRLAAAAAAVDAHVYNIDRAYQDTQNSAAKRLLTRPRELREFVRHSAAALASRGGEGADDVPPLAERLPEMHSIAVEEREAHMAVEISRRAVADSDVVVVCESDRVAGLRRRVHGNAGSSAGASHGGNWRIWPFLLIFSYLIAPVYLVIFAAWQLSGLLADFFVAMTRRGLPQLPLTPSVAEPSEES